MDSSPLEYQPCPLQFYEFQQLDNSLHCPVYTDILSHPGRIINTDSVDALRSELIALQESVRNRVALLESEVTVLDNWQVRRDYRKRKYSDGDSRSQRSETPLKKQKLADKHKKPKSKTKSREPPAQQSEHGLGPSASKYKGDAPDRFWASVEPYCADLTENDLKMLQEGIRNQENDDTYIIPPLGAHYSRKWASDDIHHEREVSARLSHLADPFSEKGIDSEQWPDESERMLQHGGSSKGKHQYGPLTERLIAAFLEDPNGSPSSGEQLHMTVPPVSVGVDTLETRIKHELSALGLLDTEEEPEDEGEDEDEVLSELKKKLDELKSINEYNVRQRQVLHKLAKQELKKQEMRQAAKEADEEVLGWLNRIIGIKQKRKGGIGRKEKEAAWRALQHREDIQGKMNHKL